MRSALRQDTWNITSSESALLVDAQHNTFPYFNGLSDSLQPHKKEHMDTTRNTDILF